MFARLRTALRTADTRIRRHFNRRRLRTLIALAQEYIRLENDGEARAIDFCGGLGPVLSSLPSPETVRLLEERGFRVSFERPIHYRKRVIPVISTFNTNAFLYHPLQPDPFL